MKALFADTFYWIALADLSDSAHRRALALTAERADSPASSERASSAGFNASNTSILEKGANH
jgi:hypothetical protein